MGSGSTTQNVPRRRIITFVGTLSTVLLTVDWIVIASWRRFWKAPQGVCLPVIFTVLTVMFIGTTMLSWRFSNVWLRVAYRIAAVWLGVLNYIFFAALLSLAFSSKAVTAALFGIAIATSIYGFVNASRPRISRVTVKLANLPAHWQGRHVALVTDMHLGNVRGAGLSQRVVGKLQQLEVESVFVSGDLFDGPKADVDALLAPWKEFSPPNGIYFVTGNHEEFSDHAKYLEAVQRVGMRVLNNEKVDVAGLQIVGVHDGELHNRELYRLILRKAKLDVNRASILLAHQPMNLAVPESEGISLQVSGHTHGGQFWPWTMVAARVHRRFNHGLNSLGKMLVLTSYGVGTWGAPMRVGTKPEIVLIRLEAA